jgi:hypothetical protein
LKFVKSDVAKYINAWELEPHYVSQGSQKNFVHYTKKIRELVEKNKLPGENFYRKLIANAILFKTADKLFGRKGVDAIGDTSIKALTVAYTVSYFHFLTNNRLDLWKIYETQRIDDTLTAHLKKLLVFVYEHIVSEASNSLISEYAKRESSWKKLQAAQYYENLPELLSDCLISEEERDYREKEKEIEVNNAEGNIFTVSEIYRLGLKFWEGLKTYVSKHQPEDLSYMNAFDVYEKIKKGKNLMPKDITFAKKILKLTAEKPELIDEIKSLSTMEETDTVEIKFIYDKLLLLSKEDWDRIIAVAERTKIFTSIELDNILSVRSSIVKKEGIKEQALLHAYESMKKLKRFGIKI